MYNASSRQTCRCYESSNMLGSIVNTTFTCGANDIAQYMPYAKMTAQDLLVYEDMVT